MRRVSYITINNESKGVGDPHGLNFIKIFHRKACLKNSEKGGFKN